MGPIVPGGCDVTAPAQTNSFTVDIVWETGAMVYWTAPGNDGTSGTAAEYDVRRSGQSPSEASFCAGTRDTMTPPQVAGSWEFLTIEDLTPCTQYFMALKTRDAVANWAALSNVGQFTTVCVGGGGGGGSRAHEAPPSPALASGTREEATPLGQVPYPGFALAAEMKFESGTPVRLLYYLPPDAAATLVADSASVVVQVPDGAGGWLTRSRLRPVGFTFAIRSARVSRRVVFLGEFALGGASQAVAAGAAGSGQALELAEARHSRLGDVRAAVTAPSGSSLGLAMGDTLSLRYAATGRAAADAREEFLRVTAGGLAIQTAARPPIEGQLAPPLAPPTAFALHGSEPNPFARETAIRLAVPRPVVVRLKVFDVLGRRVRILAAGEFRAGEHRIVWDGRDAAGTALPAGVYHVRMHAEGFSTRRVVAMLP